MNGTQNGRGADSRRLVAASLAIIRRTAGTDFAVEDCPKKGEKWCDPDWFTQADAAIDELLELMRADRSWNEEAARKQLVKIFEALGFSHP
ncbi:MAG TPA: tetratricopeptide repeat protein, partial [Spirochaetales bacterium]|nr:tetratricopeptide repeat protein [Spirochaetales bacterium]